MEPDDNYRQIVSSISEQIKEFAPDAGPFTEATDLTRDVHVDSASIMSLVFNLEESFDVSVPLNELSNVLTIGDLAKLIVKLKTPND